MSVLNYLATAINGSVRIAFVLVPSIKAASNLTQIAQKALSAALSKVGMMPIIIHEVNVHDKEIEQEKKDENWGKATWPSKAYTMLDKYLPAGTTKEVAVTTLTKNCVFYTLTAIISTFILNRLIGPVPEVYNTVAKYAGNALRMDLNYDVIQLAINYVKPAR